MKSSVVLFDGVCNLCNGAVQFVIKRDKKDHFKFASLQSDFGQKVLEDNAYSQSEFSSFLLLEDGKLYQKSDAAIRLFSTFSGLWFMVKLFYLIPRFLRDFIYDFIAKRRYKWFGKKHSCMLPEGDVRHKFIH
jgi:predicted DCC family thiol-disulfide oxidoreductase YuxK